MRLGTHVYVELIHFAAQQKLTHHCKATILQQKLIKKKRICGFTKEGSKASGTFLTNTCSFRKLRGTGERVTLLRSLKNKHMKSQ